MNSPEFPTAGGTDSNKPSTPRRELQLQGPRPTPLKIRKDSHKIKKPPIHPQNQQQQQQPEPSNQFRPPVIIYTVSPKVIHTNVNDFMTLVQRLTGGSSSLISSSSSTSTTFVDNITGGGGGGGAGGGGAISPAARFASISPRLIGSFNYDSKYIGASAKPISSLQIDEDLSKEGFFLNHSRVLVGSGFNTYEKGKNALQTWRHFGLGWTFVDPKSPVEVGAKFCVCVKEFLPWLMMPLQVAYVKENKDPKKLNASFGFGSGTLQGHLLAGEERFSIELDENNQVWYEVLSFSKPAHFLSIIGYPYVKLRQKYFAHQSANAVVKHVTQQP